VTIGIIDPGSGNLTSMIDAAGRLGLQASLLREPSGGDYTSLVLPGQGRFGAVMKRLEERGWVKFLRTWVEQGKSLIGICVGMQVMFESSEEDPGVPGLSILTGQVQRLDAPKNPMIGWSQVLWHGDAFPDGSAYFVNGYVVPKSDHAIAFSEYGQSFVSAVRHKRMTAFQFHPEKSGWWGQEVLRRCLV